MAFFKGVGNAFATVGGVFAAPFDGGKLMTESADATAEHFSTVGKDIGDGFGKDGTVTTFCENLPVVGHGVAAVHAIAGNESHAKRAAAKATNATVAAGMTAATAVAVAATGGGALFVVGATAMGGAAGTACGGLTQQAIESTYTDEDVEKVGKEQTNKTVGEKLGDMAFGGAFGAVTSGVGCAVASQAAQSAPRAAAQSMVKDIGPKALVGVATPGVAEQSAKVATKVTVQKVLPEAIKATAEHELKKGTQALGKAIDDYVDDSGAPQPAGGCFFYVEAGEVDVKLHIWGPGGGLFGADYYKHAEFKIKPGTHFIEKGDPRNIQLVVNGKWYELKNVIRTYKLIRIDNSGAVQVTMSDNSKHFL